MNNRRRKVNDLYKGVFKNDRKSCLVDLKPLDQKREIELDINKKKIVPLGEKENDQVKANEPQKFLEVNIKVGKNLGFGSYFKRLRQDIVDIFLSKDEAISFEGMFNENVSELFNLKESSNKFYNENKIMSNENLPYVESAQISNSNIQPMSNQTENFSRHEKFLPVYELEEPDEVVYEDETQIYLKRKKTKGRSSIEERKVIMMSDRDQSEMRMFEGNYDAGSLMMNCNMSTSMNMPSSMVNHRNRLGTELNFLPKAPKARSVLDDPAMRNTLHSGNMKNIQANYMINYQSTLNSNKGDCFIDDFFSGV